VGGGGRDKGVEEEECGAADGPIAARKVGAVVDTGWRGHALANHLSHGPEVRAGVSLFMDRLAVGMMFVGRPGPFNPREFTLELEDGQTYKDQSEIQLRSDGSFFALMVAPQFAVGERLMVETPVSVGQGGFGFYFQNENRDTPDGRRVSEWENELMDGRDAGFSFVVDAGVRARLRIPGKEWIQPMVGAHYVWLPQYDAFMSDEYSGFSAVAGVRLAL